MLSYLQESPEIVTAVSEEKNSICLQINCRWWVRRSNYYWNPFYSISRFSLYLF